MFKLSFFPIYDSPLTVILENVFEYSEVNPIIRKNTVPLLKGKGTQFSGGSVVNSEITLKGITVNYDLILSLIQNYHIPPSPAKAPDEYINTNVNNFIFQDLNNKKYWVKWGKKPDIQEKFYRLDVAYTYTLTFKVVDVYIENVNYAVTAGFTVIEGRG